MKKDLILITAYCDTKEKKDILYNFLKSIQNFRDRYAILLTSHLPIETFYYDYFDYCYYDKNNQLLTDLHFLQTSWYRNGDKVIWSQFVRPYNTINSILSLISSSIMIAKSLGYEKIHNFEYDTIIHSSKELDDNSKLLDEYDYVVYHVDSELHKMLGSFQSFRVDGAIDEWMDISESNTLKLYHDVYPKVPEKISYDLITNNRKTYIKHANDLISNGVDTSKIIGIEYIWNVPFVEDDKLRFFSHNPSETSYTIKIIVNDVLYDIGEVLPNHWKMETLLENFYDVENLIILKNNKTIMEINFNDYEYKEIFKKYNSVNSNYFAD